MKLDQYAKARRLFELGMPPSYVALKLGLSRTTVWYWLRLSGKDSEFAQLRRRALALPDDLRDRLVTDLTRRAA